MSSIDVRFTSDVVLTNFASGLTAQTAYWSLCVGYLKKLREDVGDNKKATSTLQQLEGTLRNINPELGSYNVVDNESNDNNANKYPGGGNFVRRLGLLVAEENRGNDKQVRKNTLRDLDRFSSCVRPI